MSNNGVNSLSVPSGEMAVAAEPSIGNAKRKDASSSSASSSERTKKWVPNKGTTSFLAGSGAGLVSSLSLQPFEVIKTRMQAPKVHAGATSNNMFVTASCIVKQEGMRGLWAGVTASCIRTAAGAGLYFLLLERVTRELNARFPPAKDKNQTLDGLRTFSMGAVSRSLAATLLCPITVVKTRMEYASVSGTTYTGVGQALVSIGSKEGVKGLFSGLGSTLLRDAPFSGLNLVMYTQMRAVMQEVAVSQGRDTSAFETFVAGAIAGGIATFATHPPDVLRTRAQLHGMRTTFAGIVKHEGVRALWVGSLPRIARRTLQQAVTWSLYEVIARNLGGTSLTSS